MRLAVSLDRGTKFALFTLATCLVVLMLSVAKTIILPLIVAVLFWYLVLTLRTFYFNFFSKVSFLSKFAKYIAMPVAIITFAVGIYLIGSIMTHNISSVMKDADANQTQLLNGIHEVAKKLGFDGDFKTSDFIRRVNIRRFIANIASGITALAKNAGLVVVYMLFLFLEQKSIRKKMNKLFSDKSDREKAYKMLAKVDKNLKTYVAVKTFISISTGVCGYVLMSAVGLQYAPFWALLLFIMNYIPTFGSLISSILPITFAVIQFSDKLIIPVILAFGFLFIEMLFGNFIEPKILGKTLNLSPLVILLSLVVWGAIWGVAGMFLCVPLMSLIMIALSSFSSTRKYALLLSENGDLPDEE